MSNLATLPDEDLHKLVAKMILDARLGSSRKDAQIDTCEVFSAALSDTLLPLGVRCAIYSATFFVEPRRTSEWAHSIVAVSGRYYDSLGQFNHAVVRTRLKIHHAVKTRLAIKRDTRGFEPEYDPLHKFYVKKLSAAAKLATVDGLSINAA